MTTPQIHRITPQNQPLLRTIPGYPLYSVTEDGRVFSSVTNRFLKSSLNKRGYPRIRLAPKLGVKQKTLEIYLLVAWAWIGPCPEGMEVAHVDGDSLNSHFSNLIYKTHRDNIADMEKHGTRCRGERSPSAKLTEADVTNIILRRKYGASAQALASEYGVSGTQIYDILNGKKWKHLTQKVS